MHYVSKSPPDVGLRNLREFWISHPNSVFRGVETEDYFVHLSLLLEHITNFLERWRIVLLGDISILGFWVPGSKFLGQKWNPEWSNGHKFAHCKKCPHLPPKLIFVCWRLDCPWSETTGISCDHLRPQEKTSFEDVEKAVTVFVWFASPNHMDFTCSAVLLLIWFSMLPFFTASPPAFVDFCSFDLYWKVNKSSTIHWFSEILSKALILA